MMGVTLVFKEQDLGKEDALVAHEMRWEALAFLGTVPC